ncbi:hypothetical protein [Rhizobium phage RHph_X2_24]|nr:hypothetical protein [Rhizobium phage RHph_X2_24]
MIKLTCAAILVTLAYHAYKEFTTYTRNVRYAAVYVERQNCRATLQGTERSANLYQCAMNGHITLDEMKARIR